ncbi:MAG: hypothetical protein WBO68_14810 [Pyrinomonadaceae bacterium]
MLKPLQILVFFLLISVLCGAGFAQGSTIIPAIPGSQIFPLSQVKEGLKGTARTVFRGTAPEEFGVEILGVIPGSIGPHQDMIIGKLSGENAMRTFVFAGMSGSPVYIDGKIVGAISYSFPFAKEPICGITPIEQMISLFEKGPTIKAAAAEARTVSVDDLRADRWSVGRLASIAVDQPLISGMSANSALAQVAGQRLQRIATPLTFAGVSQSTLDLFTPELTRAGIMPVAALGGGSKLGTIKKADAATLVGGTSVVVQLARGDISIGAAGTVTLRDGDKIYAFGHPFFSLGSTDLPMNESHVVTVVPNANNSFKLAVPDAMVGSLTQDRATGIFGKLGQTPRMIPVKIKVTNSRGSDQEIKFESAVDDFLTPLIINIGVQNTIQANERGIGETTIEVEGEISVRGEGSVKISRRFAGQQASAFASASASAPLASLLKANFEGLDITSVNLTFNITEGSKTAALERLAVDALQVKAGDALNFSVFVRNDAGKLIEQPVSITIPKDAPAGPLSLVVGDGNSVQENAAIKQFAPKSAAELIEIINSLKRQDRLYAILYRTSTGAVVGASEMPNLPPSVLATMNNDRTAGGAKPTTQKVILDQILPGSDHIVTGSQTIAVEVIR